MTTRLLLVCGSLQAASANRAALEVARGYLAPFDGVEVGDADGLARIPAFNADHANRPPEAVTDLRDRLVWSSVVMIAAPEYAGGVAGAMKNALDWIVGSGELHAKPVVVMSAGLSGGEHARRDLVRTLTWHGAHVVGSLGIDGPRTKSNANREFTDAATIIAIQDLAQRALNSVNMSPEERRHLVLEVVTAAGVDPVHVLPAS